MSKIYIATSNPGKLRELQEAAEKLGVDVESPPGFATITPAVEDGTTFEENARIKAGYYSRIFPGKLVLAEDSGLSVDELQGAPGVYSARYAATLARNGQNPSFLRDPHTRAPALPGVGKVGWQHARFSRAGADTNSGDQENNRALIAQLERLPASDHAGKYICVIAFARDGQTLATFHGEAHGQLITTPRGTGGFGYDPLFYFPSLGKTFAELSLEEKRQHSHRGQAFRRFLDWYVQSGFS